jgi:hypothetical protein
MLNSDPSFATQPGKATGAEMISPGDLRRAARVKDLLTSPGRLRRHLVHAALFLTAYELLKLSIVDQLRHVYEDCRLSIPKDDRVEEYRREVLALNKSRFMASCLWYEKNGVITAEEVKEISKIRETRNQLAHELPQLLFDSEAGPPTVDINAVRGLLTKLDRWYIRKWEIPTMEELDGKNIPDEEIMSGQMAVLELMIATDADEG